MIDGREAIILSVEEASKLLEAIRIIWSKDVIEELNRRGLLQTVDEFSSLVRRFD